MARFPRKRVLVFAFGATVTVAVVAHLRAKKRRSEAAAAAFGPTDRADDRIRTSGVAEPVVVDPIVVDPIDDAPIAAAEAVAVPGLETEPSAPESPAATEVEVPAYEVESPELADEPEVVTEAAAEVLAPAWLAEPPAEPELVPEPEPAVELVATESPAEPEPAVEPASEAFAPAWLLEPTTEHEVVTELPAAEADVDEPAYEAESPELAFEPEIVTEEAVAPFGPAWLPEVPADVEIVTELAVDAPAFGWQRATEDPELATDGADAEGLEAELDVFDPALATDEAETWAWVAAGEAQLADQEDVEQSLADEADNAPMVSAYVPVPAAFGSDVAEQAVVDIQAAPAAEYAGAWRRATDFDPIAAEDSAYDGPARRASDRNMEGARLLASAIAEQHAAEDARREERPKRPPRQPTADVRNVDIVILSGPLADDR